MIKFYCFIISFTCLLSFSQINPEQKSAKELDDLNGNIKSVVTEGFVQRTSRENPIPTMEPTKDSIIYDSNGNIVEHFMFNEDNISKCYHSHIYDNKKLISTETKCSWESISTYEFYTYDSLDNLTGIFIREDNDTISIWKYVYNEKNQLIKSISSYDTYLFEYNETGNLNKLTTIGSDSIMRHSKVLFYPNDSLVKKEFYDKKMLLTGTSLKTTYEGGNLIQEEYFDPQEYLEKSRRYYLNSFGDCVKEVTLDYVISREFIYDEKGNWISSVRYLNGEEPWPTIRKITYYN